MLLILKRYYETNQFTAGHLYLRGNARLICDTLEPGKPYAQDPSGKYGHKRIPAGIYNVIMYKSPKCGTWLPLLVGCKVRSGIEIHAGNTPEDTRGCILVGKADTPEKLIASCAALVKLRTLISDALKEEKVTIWVQDKTKKK